MRTMCPPCYHHNGFVATHAQTVHHVPKCMRKKPEKQSETEKIKVAGCLVPIKLN